MKPKPFSFDYVFKPKEVRISKQDTLELLEEMQEDLTRFCPKCNGIIINKINRKKNWHNHPLNQTYYCDECKHTFTIYSSHKKIRDEIMKFIVLNRDILSIDELSYIIKRKFDMPISTETIRRFFKKMRELNMNYPKYEELKYGKYKSKETSP
jgi:uncharacterized protein YlaI